MCGAAASTEATSCTHCGARLATVACPKCFGMMFIGEKFCSHCGAKAERTEEVTAEERLCPHCHVNMEAVAVGNAHVRECSKCEGVWVDADTLRAICEDREEQAAVLGMASHLPTTESEEEQKIRYIPCPVCKELMNRVNFANCSHVIVDICQKHGTWFDHDELRQIVEFIQAGGMMQSRAREIEEMKAEKRRLEWESTSLGSGTDLGSGGFNEHGARADLWAAGIEVAAEVLLKLFTR
jgi:Zn-finger nucleic acid-binding protein